MKSLFTKKVIIIFTVILAIAGGAIILGLAVGNISVPKVENSQEIVYEKVDQNGDVVYTITKQQLYEEMKRNNGINQLLALVDEKFLDSYLKDISQDEIDEKIKLLTYQTTDQEVIDEYDEDTIENLLDNFKSSMILSGYHDGQEEDYAKLLIAREKFVLAQISDSEDITDELVAEYYLNNYFEDIDALRLRFLSKTDASNVLNKYNLGNVNGELGLYLGFAFDDESLKDSNSDIVHAQITVTPYYYDSKGENILNLNEDVVYEFSNDIYTNKDIKDKTFTIDAGGNLVDAETSDVKIGADLLFNDLATAKTYKEDNTTFYKIQENGELIEVLDYEGVILYVVDGKKIYDASDIDKTDISATLGLTLNKNFKDIDKVKDFTENNTSSLTEAEVLKYYIEMYNYLYSDFRDPLDTNASVEDLIALDNEFLKFNFEEMKDINPSLAKFMFSDLSQINDKTYSSAPTTVGDYTYMVFKLSEGTKVDLKALVMDIIKSAIVLPETATTDIELITEGPFGSKISWETSDKTIISKTGTVLLPEEDSIVSLKFTIKVFGVQETGTKVVKVPVSGQTSTITPFDEDYDDLKTLINDDAVFAEIKELILEDMVYGKDARTNINKYLAEARKEGKIKIYDFFLGLDYSNNHDQEYDYNNKGHKTVLVSIILANGEKYEITAEAYYQGGLDRNPSLMIFFAMQFDEALRSDHFVTLFGEQTNLSRNTSDNMEFLKKQIGYIKNQYNAQYSGMFESFQTFLYAAYRVENEKMLLEKLVFDELNMSFIKESLDNINVSEKIYGIVEDNYDNFFSLKAEQILIYFDYDEDGQLDDYNDFYDGLDAVKQGEFDSLVSELENLVKDAEKPFKDIASEYKNAKRDDSDWGKFKQKGFIVKYESLNPKDKDNKEQSISYSGEYGVKDQYIKEFTDALISLYNEYKDPVNAESEELVSGLIPTTFGLHIIEVKKGSDFDGISLEIKEDDYANISESLLNDSAKPSLNQIKAYYNYKIYDTFNDLDNVSMLNKYGVTLPIIPDEVLKDLDVYANEVLNPLFSGSSLNYAYLLKTQQGQVKSDLTQAYFDENIDLLLEIFYNSTFGHLELDE